MPQIADYRMLAGAAIIFASAVTPQGQGNASEYQFGLHAHAIQQAEAAKSSVWGSVRTPPAAPTPAPLRQLWASPEQVDLSISGWVAGGTQANQGPVPPSVFTLPQDTTQLAAQIWKSQPAVISVTPNPIAIFFSIPPQIEDRQTRAIWQSLQAGQTPPIISSFYATPQPDPSQLPAQIWSAVPTPPAIVGVTVTPNTPVPPQFDPSVNPSTVWTPSTFSPSAPLVEDTGLGGSSARHPRRIVYVKGDKRKPKTFIDRIGEPFVELERTAEPVPDAASAGASPEEIARIAGAIKAQLSQFVLEPNLPAAVRPSEDDDDEDLLLLS